MKHVASRGDYECSASSGATGAKSGRRHLVTGGNGKDDVGAQMGTRWVRDGH